jgi:hypothetical protein
MKVETMLWVTSSLEGSRSMGRRRILSWSWFALRYVVLRRSQVTSERSTFVSTASCPVWRTWYGVPGGSQSLAGLEAVRGPLVRRQG